MSDQNKPRWILDGIFAVSCEFDEVANSFDFLLEDGNHKVLSFPKATTEEIEKFIAENTKYLPIIRKGERKAP
jgi:hypothetical protein